MNQVLGIKFQSHGMVYYFDGNGHDAAVDDMVVVQTEQGMGIGRVVFARESLPACVAGMEIKPIARLATEKDLEIMKENSILAKEAEDICRNYVREHDLEMKIVSVEVFFDRSKMIFYFTSPGRVDFRELVKTLVKLYRSRIEMRQIGVRHETQMIGGIGNCGMVCCCRSMLKKFASATIKMAKEQNLFLTPPKISGACGRLLCCLSFEHEAYEEFNRQCPKIGKRFKTDNGMLKVLRANFFQQSLTVHNDLGQEREIPLADWIAMQPKRIEGGDDPDFLARKSALASDGAEGEEFSAKPAALSKSRPTRNEASKVKSEEKHAGSEQGGPKFSDRRKGKVKGQAQEHSQRRKKKRPDSRAAEGKKVKGDKR